VKFGRARRGREVVDYTRGPRGAAQGVAARRCRGTACTGSRCSILSFCVDVLSIMKKTRHIDYHGTWTQAGDRVAEKIARCGRRLQQRAELGLSLETRVMSSATCVCVGSVAVRV
jgi:hypothetical protein